jgi:hypothetical protein
MKGDTASQCLLTNKFHWVNYALGILWGRASHKNGVFIACGNHGLFIGSPIGANRNSATLYIEVSASLLERGMGCGGQDHIETLILGAL